MCSCYGAPDRQCISDKQLQPHGFVRIASSQDNDLSGQFMLPDYETRLSDSSETVRRPIHSFHWLCSKTSCRQKQSNFPRNPFSSTSSLPQWLGSQIIKSFVAIKWKNKIKIIGKRTGQSPSREPTIAHCPLSGESISQCGALLMGSLHFVGRLSYYCFHWPLSTWFFFIKLFVYFFNCFSFLSFQSFCQMPFRAIARNVATSRREIPAK